jgi:signal transduction histidine kinase
MKALTKRGTTRLARTAPSHPSHGTIPFSVDSALLRELGERLVGRPHIALAELIKNSYDADATNVIIKFKGDVIEVHDNGHGMDFIEFQSFWMRIGSPHKQEQGISRNFGRPVTGSKGVGRLAVQFLGNKLKLHTVSQKDHLELQASVNWDEAIRAGELTEAVAQYKEFPISTSFPGDVVHGTVITLSGLNQSWNSEAIVELAREIWWLQPPFRDNPRLVTERQKGFAVKLEGADPDAIEKFERQMGAYLDIWHARIVGKLSEPKKTNRSQATIQLFLEFIDGHKKRWEFSAPRGLTSLEFEIRVFHLKYRQRFGIQVDQAREYLSQFGGVHVYDAGFHLPYYGIEHDWLDIEIDHSHRLSKSKLLPESLQVPEGMNYLPTQTRLLGVVHVDTSHEREIATRRKSDKEGEYLKIQISRDRLVDNDAYQTLRAIVRTALDFYAMQEARRSVEEIQALRPVESTSEKFERVDRVLTHYRTAIPEPVFTELRRHVQEAIRVSETESEQVVRHVGLLGSLATAGISALAYQHEVTKQFHLLDSIIKQLRALRISDRRVRNSLNETADQMTDWLERARSMRSLFSHLLDEENREAKARFKARELIGEVLKQMNVLIKGVDIDINEISEGLRLPEGAFTEWSAILQNVILNAVNAMIDSKVRKIQISSRQHGSRHSIIIQDTGVGVNLETADDLFKPFVRRLNISAERKALGFGGSGLGLAIVRMISGNLNTTAAFIKPEKGFRTAFSLSWEEQK